MCRRTQLHGFVLAAFGAGLLVGAWLGSGFFCMCAGLGLLGLGIAVAQKK